VNNQHLIHIGTFGKPLGLNGEVKIIMHTFNFDSFKSLSPYLTCDGKTFWNFNQLNIYGSMLVGILQNCNTRNCAEKLNGKKIFIDKNNLPKTKKEYFYISLINCVVMTSNNKLLGNIINIDNFGAGDLINIKNSNGKSFYIPMNKDNIVKVDINRRLVIVNPIKGMLD